MEIIGIELRVGDWVDLEEHSSRQVRHVRGPLANGSMSYRLSERHRRYVDRAETIDVERPS